MKIAWGAAFFLRLLAAPSFAGEPAISVRPAEVYQGGIAEIRVSGGNVAGVKALRGNEEIAFFTAEDGSYSGLMGFDLEQRSISFDVGNRLWADYEARLKASGGVPANIEAALRDRGFWAVYYGPIQAGVKNGSLWVFIDRQTGQIITSYGGAK